MLENPGLDGLAQQFNEAEGDGGAAGQGGDDDNIAEDVGNEEEGDAIALELEHEVGQVLADALVVGVGFQEFGGQPDNEDEHGGLGQVGLVDLLLVDHAHQHEDALLGRHPGQLVGVAGQDGRVGEQGEGGVLVVAEHADEGLVLLVLRDLHQDGLEQLHVVLDELVVVPEDAGAEQVLVQGALRQEVDQLLPAPGVRDQQVQAL